MDSEDEKSAGGNEVGPDFESQMSKKVFIRPKVNSKVSITGWKFKSMVINQMKIE